MVEQERVAGGLGAAGGLKVVPGKVDLDDLSLRREGERGTRRAEGEGAVGRDCLWGGKLAASKVVKGSACPDIIARRS